MVPHMASPAPSQQQEQQDGDLAITPTGIDLSQATPVLERGCDDAVDDATGPERPANGRRSITAIRLSASNAQNAKDREPRAQLKPIPSNTSTVVGLDSLSNQIYLRTNSNTEPQPSIAQRLRVPGRPESPNIESAGGPTSDTLRSPPNEVVDATKEWRKGTSFLSRLSMRPPWSRDDDAPDSDSEMGEMRDDGAHARALTSVAGAGGGYIPFYKEPPRYIKVKTRNKKVKEFNHLFLAQELSIDNSEDHGSSQGRAPATAVGRKILRGDSASIWAAEFSLDGRYLAVGGKDGIVRVYAVLSTADDRLAQESDEAECQGATGEKLSAPVFRSKPVREFQGHTGEVLALSWSKNGFLLSSSMDKTVRLWLPSKPQCLCIFQHPDIVTSIAFHPTDDRFFLAGCLDSHLRLWSIPDKSAPFSTETKEFITAVGFSPDGKTSICGVLSGMCTFYKTEGLESEFQIHVRSSRGKNAKGSKITGIETAWVDEGPDKTDVKVLISSNDSRVRVYSLTTRMLEAKFRGHVNQSSQIHARFGDDPRYIICGSEDSKAYIWGPSTADAETRDKQPYECFDAHPEVVTTAVIAPTKSRQLLSASGDPIYDLCNPPPVMLMSLDESQSSMPDTEALERNRNNSNPKRPEETPAYLERCKHQDGNIIITTDRTGTIKVFRQDCAYSKRQQNLWETGSKFSGKLASGVGRSGSVRTKASGTSRAHSRRGSLSINQSPASTQPASDRIMSWRQDVDGGFRPSRGATPTRSERSISPAKARLSSINTSSLASDSRKDLRTASIGFSNPGSPTSSVHTTRNSGKPGKGRDLTPTNPPTPSFSFLSIADAKEKAEGSFWNLGRWRGAKQSNSSLDPGAPAEHIGRRSMGVPDTARLDVQENKSHSRRVSSGAKLASESSKAIAGERATLKKRDSSGPPSVVSDPSQPDVGQRTTLKKVPQRPAAGKQRVDSGLGRLSGDSTKE